MVHIASSLLLYIEIQHTKFRLTNDSYLGADALENMPYGPLKYDDSVHYSTAYVPVREDDGMITVCPAVAVLLEKTEGIPQTG
jgi:hypothetical protein